MTFRPFYLGPIEPLSSARPEGRSHIAGLCRGVIFFTTLAAILLALAGAASGPPTFGTPALARSGAASMPGE